MPYVVLIDQTTWHPEVNQVSWWSNTKNLTYKMDILWCFMQHLTGMLTHKSKEAKCDEQKID